MKNNDYIHFIGPQLITLMALEFGIDVDELKSVGGWSDEDLKLSYKAVDLRQFLAIISPITNRMPPERGLERLIGLTPAVDRQIGYLSASLCENVGSMLSHMESYFRFITLHRPQIINSDDGVTFKLATFAGTPNSLKMSVSRMLFCLLVMRHSVNGPLNPVAATFNFDIDTEPFLSNFLGIQPTAGPYNSLTFSHADLHRPLVSFDDELYQLMCNEPDRRLVGLNRAVKTTSIVASIIEGRFGYVSPVLGECASVLGLSPRSLQRALKDENTCFACVLDDVRRDGVIDCLAQGQMSKSQIAFHIGLRDTNSLYRLMRK